jgi:hypothetical protein
MKHLGAELGKPSELSHDPAAPILLKVIIELTAEEIDPLRHALAVEPGMDGYYEMVAHGIADHADGPYPTAVCFGGPVVKDAIDGEVGYAVRAREFYAEMEELLRKQL